MATMGDTEPSVSPVVINIGGEGEIVGALNVNLPHLQDPDWRCSRDGSLTLADLQAQGHVFMFVPDMSQLPFADASVDIIHTNNVCIDAIAYLGPCPRSSEIWRVRKSGGIWYRDGILQEPP
jgi:hypothetical protein